MPSRTFHVSSRARRPALALLLLAGSLVVPAQTVVLDPHDLGTYEQHIERDNASYMILPDLLATLRLESTSPRIVIRQSPHVRFDLQAFYPDQTLLSATYTTRRERRRFPATPLTLSLFTGSLGLVPRSGSVATGTFSSDDADAGIRFDCTAALATALKNRHPYALFGVKLGTDVPTSDVDAVDAWYATGAFAPKLTLVFAPSPKATFTPLGSLAGPAFFSSPRAISADGATIVGQSQTAAGPTAFVWTAAKGMFDIGLGAQEANDVSGDGKTIVGQARNGYAFRWSAPGKVANLGFGARANTISADGTVVGGAVPVEGIVGLSAAAWTATARRVYTYEWAQRRDRALAPSEIVGASADGQALIGTLFPSRFGGSPLMMRQGLGGGVTYYRGTGGTGFSTAPGPMGSGSIGRAISADGAMVGLAREPETGMPEDYACRITGRYGLQTLLNRISPYESSDAMGISPDGSTIVGTYRLDGRPRAFLHRDALGFVDLQEYLASRGAMMTGWTLTEARDATILWDGRILVVGTGIDPLGRTQGFRAVIPPASPPAIRP